DRGLNVACGKLRGSAFAPGSFDVVTMWDVIEHFPDPAAEVREVHRLLRPGGLVGITTMNVESLVARLLGPRWPWLMQMHLYYFSVRTLRALAGGALVALARRGPAARRLAFRPGGTPGAGGSRRHLHPLRAARRGDERRAAPELGDRGWRAGMRLADCWGSPLAGSASIGCSGRPPSG